MRLLRDPLSITAEIESSPDPLVSKLLAARVEFNRQYEDEYEPGELLNVIVIEAGDTLQVLDAEMGGHFLSNAYSAKRFGDAGFKPCWETLEEYSTFYEMLFIQSDEGHGLAVIVPKEEGIDPELLVLCERHATPAQELPS